MRQRNANQLIGFILLMGALLLVPLAPAHAQRPTPPAPPPPQRGLRYEIDQQGMLPLLPGAELQAQAADVANAPACAPWSRLTFASYRDKNDWEVYVANGDGTGQTRLTNNSTTDTAPKYNRGCTRIVYQSLQGAQYDVFVMNANGSGQTRLTKHSANDGLPCWSPDSARIAFQTDRDGNNEVYVMNADGSGQTNITNHPAYDGMPAWSPDGARIAFVSNRTGQYEIWVMNPDGTGQTQVTHGVAWAEYPSWSPDGSQIAFDNDDNGDGFMDVDVVNADGTGLVVLAGHKSSVDYWYPTWSPDSEWIAYGRTELVYYEGQWYWTRSDIYAFGAPKYDYALVALAVSGYDWRPHWGTLDTQPPTSKIHGLASFTGLLDPIHWSGQDVGPAGLWSYDVQYRDGESGAWTDWLVNTRDTFANFSGVAGHTYYFRCRARDRAGNVASYSSTGPYPHTMFYTYRLVGRVHDIRDTPVTSAIIDITPLPLFPAANESTDYYNVYLTGLGSNIVDVGKAGYGIVPPMSLQAIQAAQPVTTFLPPPDNQVQNGGFEASSSTISGWLSHGAISPTVTNESRHTGHYAVHLAPSSLFSFAPELKVSNTSVDSKSLQIAMDESGTIHVVWSGSTFGYTDIYYIRRGNSGIWSDPQNISNTSGTSSCPRLAIDGNGCVHVIWRDVSGIYHAQRGSDGTWSSPQSIPESKWGGCPELAIDRSGKPHVIWLTSQLYYTTRGSDGIWSTPQIIINSGVTKGNPQLVIDGNGIVHVVCTSSQGVCYTQRWKDGSWSNSQYIFYSDPYPPDSLQLAVDKSDSVHAIWQYGDYLYYAWQSPSGIWSTPQPIGDLWASWISRLVLAVDGDSTVHAAWEAGATGNPSNREIYYARRGNDGNWSSPQNISNLEGVNYSPQLVVDKSGIVHIAWINYCSIYYVERGSDGTWSEAYKVCDTGDDFANLDDLRLVIDKEGFIHTLWYNWVGQDIYYSRSAFARQTRDSAITQAVTVPSTLHYPTLSFVYQLHVAGTTGGWFKAGLYDGIVVTQIFSASTSTPGWAHAWADLTPWAGQTITLTFNVHNEAGAPVTWAYLDEVSLGSAYPNLWVGKSSSTVPPGGGPVRYAITYGNLGGVPAQGVRITDTLPAGVTFLSASVPPTSTAPLVWDVGPLAAGAGPYTIIVTGTVAAGTPAWTTLTNTVRIGGATPEADKDNNTAVAQTFVGYRLYLPLAAREW